MVLVLVKCNNTILNICLFSLKSLSQRSIIISLVYFLNTGFWSRQKCMLVVFQEGCSASQCIQTHIQSLFWYVTAIFHHPINSGWTKSSLVLFISHISHYRGVMNGFQLNFHVEFKKHNCLMHHYNSKWLYNKDL